MYIVDTNILMSIGNFQEFLLLHKKIAIPYEVLNELDNLKTSEGERGFKARRAIRNIEKFSKELSFIKNKRIFKKKLNKVDDMIIDYFYNEKFKKNNVLLTNDIGMKIKAKSCGIKTLSYSENKKLIEWKVEKELLAQDHKNFLDDYDNKYGVEIGQYFIIRTEGNAENRNILKYVAEDHWKEISLNQKLKNYLFAVTPRDDYQLCAIDSLINDSMSIITGPAGTGKTLLSLAYCLKRIKEADTKVHIFVNPVKTRGSEELGFYPGSRSEKLLQNFIGDILKNKIGDLTEVYKLIDSGLLNIYPISDIRGIEVGAGEIMYITEGQNLSVDLMKLAVQRCAEGSKVIIEGDPFTQVDKSCFEGESNGLKRLIKVFFGFDEVGYVHLSNIYRSKFAAKAEEM